MTKPNPPSPERRPGFSRDKDLERGRDLDRPADAEMDATERSADRKPEEHIDYPADVEDEEQS
ncbi:MAG TPA: hypothetical protein VD840_01465 [Sinorhizobium sp.]|nr:hypothetical protein [Sinorhizobium sp.]